MPKGVNDHKWALDLKKFGEQTREEALKIFRKVVLDLDSRIVLGTPVDTGQARGNWFPSINVPSEEVTKDVSPTGEKSIQRVSDMLDSLELGDTAWLTNNLPYINWLEDGNSKQAPAGMVEININTVQAIYGGEIER